MPCPHTALLGARVCGVVLVDQMRSVDRQIRLGDFAGRLEPHALDEVDHACRLVLGPL
ncbi:type II toxin-antitoxin system PemK/MazF family toxin [Nocardiopsis sp. NRRL B-16309]|uniref:type II toxin-antitoxin system PemK/MazF family toxin n=1 Tax=Nocardiopsis sp. NRRL B-16309 TaxID=1519494 RepID=UPI00350E8E25